MKSVKFLFVFAFLAISALIAKSQVVSDINETTFFKAKYRKDKVWDVKRSPAFPIAGQNWTLSGLMAAYDANGGTIDWGQDRYLMLVAEVDNTNGANSLVDDVNKSAVKYSVSLQLFESNGALVKVVSKWGKIAGIGEKGFMYEEQGYYGTFFSVAAVPSSTIISYKPTLGTITKLSELVNTSDLTKSLEVATGISDGPFFSTKYRKENVWDVQRSPAYPIAGQDWTLSGLKGALDNSGASLDWGQDRYLMLVPEVDNANSANSLIDDINNNGSKHNVSLKLYESNGTLVKVVSKWGKIAGIGEKGFMYEEEGRFGTFFFVAVVNATTVIKYKPTLAAVTKLSELINASDLTKSLNVEKASEGTKNMEVEKVVSISPFFKAKYTKNQAWDVQRSPANPVAGQDWTLSGLKCALDASGVNIDWGTGRYLMIVASAENSNKIANTFVYDIYKNNARFNLSLRLYESNGTLVKVISKWGNIKGMGDKGFVYEVEGKYGTFFSTTDVNPSSTITYKPRLADVTKQTELIQNKKEGR